MKKHLLAASLLVALSATAAPAKAPAPVEEEVPADIKRGVELSNILLNATYEALAPGSGAAIRLVHAREIAEAQRKPLTDSTAWKVQEHPPECFKLWQATQGELAKVAGHFQLSDFHSNEQVELAVVESMVALSVPVKVLYDLGHKLETPPADMSNLCVALTKALPSATAAAYEYKAKAKSEEYLDLSKLTVTAMSKGIPALIEAQAAARY